jgi:hypothetical protein
MTSMPASRRPGNDFGSTVVTVEPGFGNHNSRFSHQRLWSRRLSDLVRLGM